jgi:ATP-binding cassette, subfamily C, bacterial exporter for protease/lipase
MMKLIFFERSQLTKAIYSFRREFMWVGIFSMIANLLMLSPTIYMLQIFDRVFISQSEVTLLFLTLIIILFFCMMAFAEWLRSRLLVRAGIKLDQQLNTLVFNASFEAYLRRVHQNPTESFSNLTNLRQFLTGNGIIVFFDAPWAPIYILIIFVLHPSLGLLSLIFAGILLYMAIYAQKMTGGSSKNSSQMEAKSKAYLFSKLKNAEPVEAMGMVENLSNRWMSLHLQHQKALAQYQDNQHQQQAIAKFIRYCMQSLTLGAAALLVIDGQLSIGAMIAANVLMARSLQPLDLLVGSWSGLIQARTAFISLEKLLEEHPERDNKIHFPEPKGNISIKQLSAHAPYGGKQILHALNAKFDAGQVTAIIGPSGSGKSTLARCLVGIWPDFSGIVLWDKTRVDSWDREQLGPYIGYLPQDIELFDGSIAENISRFYDVDSEKVVEAAKRAGIHEMVLRFPMGYDTPVGEGGIMLSGGQRQRLGLARAIYGNPMVIVLDEPNANLDDVGERALVQAISDFKAQGKTIFLITHRLNILEVADHLLVLNEGSVSHYGLRDDVVLAIREAQLKQKTQNQNSTKTNPVK